MVEAPSLTSSSTSGGWSGEYCEEDQAHCRVRVGHASIGWIGTDVMVPNSSLKAKLGIDISGRKVAQRLKERLTLCSIVMGQGVSLVLVHSTKRQGNRIDGESGNRGSWALGAESC